MTIPPDPKRDRPAEKGIVISCNSIKWPGYDCYVNISRGRTPFAKNVPEEDDTSSEEPARTLATLSIGSQGHPGFERFNGLTDTFG